MPAAVPNRSPAAPARMIQAITKLAIDEERDVEERRRRTEAVAEVADLLALGMFPVAARMPKTMATAAA